MPSSLTPHVAGIVLISIPFLLTLSPLNRLIRLQAITPRNIASAVPNPIATVSARIVGTFHLAGSLMLLRLVVPFRWARQPVIECPWDRGRFVGVSVGDVVSEEVEVLLGSVSEEVV